MENIFATPTGRVRVVSLAEVRDRSEWPDAFHGCAKDHRYYELTDETLRGQFEFIYLIVEGQDGRVLAIQSCFVVEQDLLATAPRWVRAMGVRCARVRMLMVGCAAGEGRLGVLREEDEAAVIATLTAVLPQIARMHRASLIVWKDFPPIHREALGASKRFVRTASMPATRLALGFTSFDDFLAQRVSHATRKDLRRKFRATRDVQIEMQVVNSVSDFVNEAHALYEQVLARSPLQFERLTKEFLLRLGERMPDAARFFLWRNEGRLVAFSVCLERDGVLYDEYLGMDYSVALDWHLYFVTLRDVLKWAIGRGLKEYRSTPLNYDPKVRLGFLLAPLDVYVGHTNPVLHGLLRLVLPWIEPTRAEPALRRFANTSEM